MRIGSIVITFNPEETLFLATVESLSSQVDELCVIDNGSNNLAAIRKMICMDNRFNLISLDNNYGFKKE